MTKSTKLRCFAFLYYISRENNHGILRSLYTAYQGVRLVELGERNVL